MSELLSAERLRGIRAQTAQDFLTAQAMPMLGDLLAHIDAQQAEIGRLRALLGEAKDAALFFCGGSCDGACKKHLFLANLDAEALA